jgi:hypothetical protein
MSDDDSDSSSSSYFSSSSSDSGDDASDVTSTDLDLDLNLDFHTNYTGAGNGIVAANTLDGEMIIDVYGDGDGGDGGDGGLISATPRCNISDIEYRLQTSIFYVEPVTHVTCQIMFVDSVSNTLTQIDTRIMRLAIPNTIDRFDIGRIIKASRYAPDGSLKFRLGSLFVYNAHVPPSHLSSYVADPDTFSFVTPLTSISSFIIKPTMACFHSLNSIHIVLHSLGVVAPLLDPPTADANNRERRRSKPVSKLATSTLRTVTITKTALATRRNNHKQGSRPNLKYHPR